MFQLTQCCFYVGTATQTISDERLVVLGIYYSMTVSLKVILYSTTHVSPTCVSSHMYVNDVIYGCSSLPLIITCKPTLLKFCH